MHSGTWMDAAIVKAIARARGISEETEDFPHITNEGEWQCTPDGVWTGGFWAGILWLAYEKDGGDDLLRLAVNFTDRLLPAASASHNHDLGFMFEPSAVKGWEITGNETYRLAALNAAEALAGQFNTAAGFIPGWGFFGKHDWSGSVLIDTLMNLPLLAWAVQQGASQSLMDVVYGQVAKTLEHHFRPDGSVYHVYKFDPTSGIGLGGDTYQGQGPESCWSRGQAWAITGLAALAKMTGDNRFLEPSERVAAYFLGQIGDDGIPPWDFSAEGPEQPKDSSAGAIASCGLLKLFDITGNRRYLEAASNLLHAMAETCGGDKPKNGLLLHATADLPHGLGIDGSTMYGDYYYLKGLLALQSLDLPS